MAKRPSSRVLAVMDPAEKKAALKKRAPKRSPIKHTGVDKTSGKSNKLGYGGRAAQMKRQGVPGYVIGAIARKEGAAPGGPNYHGKKK